MRAWVNAAVMPLSLKLPRRVHPLVLQEQPARLHARRTRPTRVGPLAERLPFADGHDRVVRGEREQLAEPPHAGEVERVGAVGPLRLEVLERLRHGQPVPVVGHVEQAAALRAAEGGVGEVDGGPAVGVDAALKGGRGHAWRPVVVRRGDGGNLVGLREEESYGAVRRLAATRRLCGAERGGCKPR